MWTRALLGELEIFFLEIVAANFTQRSSEMKPVQIWFPTPFSDRYTPSNAYCFSSDQPKLILRMWSEISSQSDPIKMITI